MSDDVRAPLIAGFAVGIAFVLLFSFAFASLDLSTDADAIRIPPPSIPPPPRLDSEHEQRLAEIALNVEGVKEWSAVGWQVQSIDFGGTTEPELRWTYAVVWLKLPAEVKAPAYCEIGWVAMVVINLETMEVESADYPRNASDADCRGIEFGRPLI